MITLIFVLVGLCLVRAQSPQERLPSIVDDLWEKIEKAETNVTTELEINEYFARWDTDGNDPYWLDEAKFVAGWQQDFGHDANESAAMFRAFDWEATDEFTVVDPADIRNLVFRLGWFEGVSETSFKSFLKVYFQGHCFAIIFNNYRTIGSGRYDDYISDDDWVDRIFADLDNDGDDRVSQDEYRVWFSPKYGTNQTADAAHLYVDELDQADGFISALEWTTLYLNMKLLFEYPELQQLHFQEWIQYERAVLGTPRPTKNS